jgi:hypothetical protein
MWVSVDGDPAYLAPRAARTEKGGWNKLIALVSEKKAEESAARLGVVRSKRIYLSDTQKDLPKHVYQIDSDCKIFSATKGQARSRWGTRLHPRKPPRRK